MTQYLLYGGKGGVGKTTCAAATGIRLADQGERTLVVSTDPAHSLGEALETDLSGDPAEVAPDCYAVEADPEDGQETYRRIVESLAATFREAGIGMDEDDVDRLFAAGLVPGSDEVAALKYLDDPHGEWDRVVLDTAPTGHTLRLLTLPDVLEESMATAENLQGQVRSLITSARSMVMGPAAFLGGNDDEEIHAFRDRMDRVAERLRDPSETGFRVVLVPETLAVAETRQLVERLRSFDVPVEELVVNRALDPEAAGDCDRCAARAESHERAIDRIRSEFPDLPVRVLPDLGPEAYGRDALERLGSELVP